MQQLNGNRHFYPLYVDKLVLFFTPTGGIIVRLGNRYILAGEAEVRELVDAKLVQHARFTELFNGGEVSHEQEYQ